MSFESITVIGVGAVGGNLVKNLIDNENIEKIQVVDDDIVEYKNIKNQIYKFDDIGKFKVDVLYQRYGLFKTIIPYKVKFVEGLTSIQKTDLIIDCRDYVHDRSGIDVRLYLSGRRLVIDCRKYVKNISEYQGKYLEQLEKCDINKAAFYAANLIESGEIEEFIKNEHIVYFDIDTISTILKDSCKYSEENRIDLVCDESNLVCIEENLAPIMKAHKNYDMRVLIDGDEITLDRLKFHTPHEFMNWLSTTAKQHSSMSNFIVSFKKRKNDYVIELFEEAGAA